MMLMMAPRMTALFVVLLAMIMQSCSGIGSYRDLIPNARKVPNVLSIGHTDPSGGGPRNQFGKDFGSNARSWSKICSLDSDGDGVSNGRELGDPCCKWTVGNDDLLITTGLSNPGDSSSITTNVNLTSAECPADSSDSFRSDSSARIAVAITLIAAGLLRFLF